MALAPAYWGVLAILTGKIYGGAKVINEFGDDVTDEQLKGAEQFLKTLVAAGVGHAILMDGSPSCGSNVLLKEENWPRGGFKKGVGVTSALLRNNGLKVLSSFDERSICNFIESISPDCAFEGTHIDLKENPKFRFLFEGPPAQRQFVRTLKILGNSLDGRPGDAVAKGFPRG